MTTGGPLLDLAAGECAAALFTLVSSVVRKDLDVWPLVKAMRDRLLDGLPEAPSRL
jgi:hypothetical protein